MSVALKIGRSTSQGGIPLGRNVSVGDPGLFGDIWKGVKSIGRAAVGLALPAPLQQARSMMTRPQVDPRVSGPVSQPLAGPRAAIARILPMGATGVGTGCPSGYRPNKSSYFLKDGTFVDKGARCVKNRRRNPANARATSRAISRIDGAKRMQHTLANIETKTFTKAGKRKHPHR